MGKRGALALALTVLVLLSSTVAWAGPSGRPAHAPPAAEALPRATAAPATVTWNVVAAPVPLLRVALGFSAAVTLPDGGVDQGSELATGVELSVPAVTNLTVGYANASGALPVNPLGTFGPVAVPGLNVTVLGTVFQVEVAVATAIVGNLSVAGPATLTPNAVRWNASGSAPFTLSTDPAARAGDGLTLNLSGLAWALEANVTAVGNVPVLGRTTLTLLPWTDLGSFEGSPSFLVAPFTVTPPPSIQGFTAEPNPVGVGGSTDLRAEASGGSGPLTYAYGHLPPGCTPADLSELTCAPSSSGRYAVTLTVSDAQGEAATAELNLSVRPAASPWAAVLLSPPGLVALAAVAGLVIGLLAWRVRRSRVPR